MTIDKDTGCILLPEIDAVISPLLSRTQFLQAAAFSAASVTLCSEPWYSYRLPSIPQSETELFIVLQFQGEQLLSLHLAHGSARFGTSWADWTLEQELARQAFNEHWLTSDLCLHLGEYSWGDISSIYDDKGGSSFIRVCYDDRNT